MLLLFPHSVVVAQLDCLSITVPAALVDGGGGSNKVPNNNLS